MSDTTHTETQDASFGAMARALPEAVSLISDDGIVLEANDAFCRLVGFSREALIGRLVPLRDGMPTPSGGDQGDVPDVSRWLSPVVLVAGDGSHSDVLASFARLEHDDEQRVAFVMSVRLEWIPTPRLLRDPKAPRPASAPRTRTWPLCALSQTRRRVSSELELAAHRGEFFARYQPIVSLRDGEIEAFEALLRWDHPAHGVLGPASFIGEAESRGILADITCQVVHDACHDAVHWNELRRPGSLPVSVSVNLCGSQLRHPRLLDSIANALAASELAPARLWLEITENTGITEATRDPGLLSALRGLGVRIVLDDFGSGYASLGSVRKLPLDILKFDRSLVSGVAENRCDARILAAGVEIAEALEIDVIAEGIEQHAQLDYVKALDCKSAQGFYFSRPVDRERADLLVAEAHNYLTHHTQAA
jgi:EAL domain-containing protein (putative c-di-GMP-specific phosphodiesterase class I)